MKDSNPKDLTNFSLLEELVPDIKERLEAVRKEKPELFEEIRRRAVDTPEGWRPLHFWQGMM